MLELGPKAHRRMMKVKLEARAAESSATPTTNTIMGSAQATVSTAATSTAVVSAIPTSTAAIVAVAGALALILIFVAGCCFWRRRKLRAHKKGPSTTVNFNRDVFAAEKKTYGLQDHVRADLTSIGIQSPTASHKSPPSTPSETEESTYIGWAPQVPSNFRVTNNNSDRETLGYLPVLPKAVAEKHRPSQRVTKPAWISTNPEDIARSPPPAYDLANGSPGFVFPVPAEIPAQKAMATPAPPTLPANRKSEASSKKSTVSQVLTIPVNDDYALVPSPARSESFAPKDLVIPTPPTPATASSSTSSPPVSGSSSQGFSQSSSSSRTPRMMTVIAPYTPSLPDELRITVGDTVRLLQEYKDGWCFAQYVGKADAPKGVVPLVCLQERRRMVPTNGHRGPNGSNTSLTSLNASWRI